MTMGRSPTGRVAAALAGAPVRGLGWPPPAVHPQALLASSPPAVALLGHPLVLLGGPRALLLQLAHPSVAAGVADHSDFRADPFDRLLRTLSAMATISFADPARSEQSLAAVAATHRQVRGRGPDGRPYSAHQPHLAAWVHATLIDTALAVEQSWLGAWSDAERDRFYTDTLALARAFSVPAGALPSDRRAFDAWFARTVTELRVGDQARALAAEVLRPPLEARWGRLGRPTQRVVWAVLAAVTVDLLPSRLRLAYGLPAPSRAAQALLSGAQALSRRVAPHLPPGARRPDTPLRVAALLTGRRP